MRPATLLVPAAILAFAGACFASTAIMVSQRGRAFSQLAIELHAGDVLHVQNDDEFVHQVYVDNPQMSFESDEQAPGEALDVPFRTRGHFELRCHIHPKMHLSVDVQ